MKGPFLIAAALFAGTAVVVGAVLLVSGMARRNGVTDRTGPYRGSEPPAGIIAQDFTLRSYRGGTVSMGELRGKVVVLSFVDTKCKESCPIVTTQIASALRLLTPVEQGKVVPLLITVDPKVDTDRSIKRFLERRRALSLDYLVGSVRVLKPIWRAYGVLPAVETGNPNIHSSDVRVFDRQGMWVSMLHVGVDLTPQNLAADVREALGGAK